MKAELYEITLFFPRLFADPAVFEDPARLANRYLLANGLPRDGSDFVCQTTDEIVPEDDRGNPSTASGTAKYSFEGRTILAEFMSNATIRLAYADFGTGLTPNEHPRLWRKGKLGQLRFELREFKHQSVTINIPDVSVLYRMLKERATSTTLSTVELNSVPEQALGAAVVYIRGRLLTAAKADGLEVEVYAAKDLASTEKSALEKRIGRESNKKEIFVILSRKNLSVLNPPVG